MQKILLCLLAIVISLKVFSQKENCRATLKGKVIDAATGLIVEDAVVYLQDNANGTYTNVKGEYLLSDLCKGKYILVCKHLQHEEKKETIIIETDIQTKNIYLTCHSDTLHDVKIRSSRIHWEDVSVSHKIGMEEIQNSAGLSLGKTLEKINGVYNLSTGNTINKPIIRGMHSNRILIINNGIRQEGQQWGNEHAPEIDPFIAKSIEVVKGAQSIRYGSDIIGGLILLNPKPMNEIKQNNGEISSAYVTNGRLTANSATLEGRLKKLSNWSWRVQGTYKRGGNTRTPQYFLKNTGVKELNYSLGIGYNSRRTSIELFQSAFHTTIGIYSGSHIGNLTDLYRAFNSTQIDDSTMFSYTIDFPYQFIRHNLSKVKMEYVIDSVFSLHLLYGYQRNIRKEFDKNIFVKNDDGTYRPSLNFELNTQNADISIEHKEIKHINGSVGINGFYQTNNYYGNYFIPNYWKLQGGLYWVEKWHRNALSLEAGVRYDINHFRVYKWEQNELISPLHKYQGFAATFAARYQLPFITIHGNVGSAWRAPFVNELYSYGVHHSAASFEIGDKALTPERGYNASLTFDFNYHKKVDMELSVFNNYVKNYINLQPALPATLTVRGAFPTFQYSQSNVNFFGIEWSANTSLNIKTELRTKANTLYVKDILNKKYIVGIPPARAEAELLYVLYEQKENKISASVSGSYTFKQNRVKTEDDYVPAPAAYFLTNASIEADYKCMQNILHCSMGVNNLFNTSYRDYLNRNRYYAIETGRNIFIRLHIPFTF